MEKTYMWKVALLLMSVCMRLSAMMDIVTLQSGDEQNLLVESTVAQRSKILKDHIEKMGSTQPIPIPNTSGKTVQHLVALMKKVHELEGMGQTGDQIYVPRMYQPFVDKELADISLDELIQFCNLMDDLDLPIILNAVAAVLVDRLPDKFDVRDDFLQLILFSDGLEDTRKIEKLKERSGMDIRLVQRNTLAYIAKHLVLRKFGMAREYSIADYIKEHGQPPLEQIVTWRDAIDLHGKGLTSLFGIGLLENKVQAKYLDLSFNCFFDVLLDSQRPIQPFIGFDSLQRLNLSVNWLRSLPKVFFEGLTNLKELILDDNDLRMTKGVFSGLTNLEELSIANNKLRKLPAGIFNGLDNLERLNLRYNLFDKTQQVRLKKELNNVASVLLGMPYSQ